MLLRCAVLLMIAAAVFGGAPAAQDRKPPLAPGRDPGGVAIALLTTGIDYTLPNIAQRLARDGEGELIGWDVADQDRKPFDKSNGASRSEHGGDGTRIASLLAEAPGTRLVPVRVDPGDAVSLARAIAFVAQTPARIAALPMWSATRQDWEPLRQAALRFKDVLVIVPAGSGAEMVYPAALGLENVLAVGGMASAEVAGFGGTRQRLSGEALAVAGAAKAAAEVLTREPLLDAGALKRRLGEAGGGELWQARR